MFIPILRDSISAPQRRSGFGNPAMCGDLAVTDLRSVQGVARWFWTSIGAQISLKVAPPPVFP